MKRAVHQAHIGTESCLRRARECLYWPRMKADMKDYISMFDLQSGTLPTSFKQFIPRDANDYTSTIITRQHDNIQRQRPRTTFSSKLPKHNFIKIIME